jgi:DivIVA domain-containing protein
MDEDDPEKRISELERRLAAPRTAGRPGSLTPELVRNVAFAKPPIGKRGYNEDEVDAFLDLVGEHLQLAGALRPPPPSAIAPPPVDRPTARHAEPESWLRRVVNAVIQFFGSDD